MNLLDVPGIDALRPEDVQQYLLHAGWEKAPPHYQGALTYARPAARRGKASVKVPIDRAYADYTRRMAEVVETLSSVEQRSPLDVLSDLLLPPSDTIHCRVHSDVVQSGLIPLDDSIRLRQGQKHLLLACAHTEIEPKMHFQRLAHAEALELLRSCREGPTSRGSYATTLVVPVDPAVGQGTVEPFARRVTRRLMEALDETARLCEVQDAEGLLAHAKRGVSANFLMALAELRPAGAQSFVELGVSWSRARPAPPVARTRVRFSEGVFGLLAEAGQALRDRSPAPGVEVEGFVVRLARGPHVDKPGEIVIAAMLTDRPGTSMVHVELSRDEYEIALDAHKQGRRVRAMGTLAVERRTLRLLKAAGFQAVERSGPEDAAGDDPP